MSVHTTEKFELNLPCLVNNIPARLLVISDKGFSLETTVKDDCLVVVVDDIVLSGKLISRKDNFVEAKLSDNISSHKIRNLIQILLFKVD